MDATRLAEILSDPTVLNLDCLLGDPDHAAIPGLKKIIMRHEGELIPHIDQRTYPWSGSDFLAALAALGACVMAAEDALTDTQIDDYLEAVSPVSPSCICAVESNDRDAERNERGPSATSLHRFAEGIKEGDIDKCIEGIGGKIKAPETAEAIKRAKEILAERSEEGDERLLEDIAEAETDDITTIRDEAIRTLGSIMRCASERRDRIKAAEAILRNTLPSER